MKRINHISLYIIFLSCLKGKRKKKFNKKRWKYDTINYSVCRIFLCPIVNRRERPLEIQGRRVESIKRGVHILTRKKDIRRLCVHRACIRRKEREREERRGSLGRNKTKEARMRKAFFGDICRVLARELCVGPPVSGQAGLGRPDFSKVAHSSNLSCSHTGLVYRPALDARFLSNAKRKMDDGGKEREREREKEGIPVLSAFGHFRWLTFSPEPINVFTQSSYGFWIFFFSINDSFLIIDNSSSRSVKKISI